MPKKTTKSNKGQKTTLALHFYVDAEKHAPRKRGARETREKARAGVRNEQVEKGGDGTNQQQLEEQKRQSLFFSR